MPKWLPPQPQLRPMTTGIDLCCFDRRCQGESHKATNKPCQDYSFSEQTSTHTIAIVSDGHGGTRYYRSDVGSRLLCEVTALCLSEFAKGVPESTFAGKPYTTVGIGDTMPGVLQQLFGAIVVGWRRAVMEHADHHPLTESELAIAVPQDEHEWEKTYGCTLIAALRTPSYWLAFQVGDGKCVALQADGTPYEPIPWDDRCFLNKTTSICDTDVISRFRCCYGGVDTAPVAIFLGSDGIDDSFGEEENLYNFYVQLAKGFVRDGYESTVSDLERTLPILSHKGSQDDMSVSGFYDYRIQTLLPQLVQWQVGHLEAKADEAYSKFLHIWADIIKCVLKDADRMMAYNDLTRYHNENINLQERIKRLKQEME